MDRLLANQICFEQIGDDWHRVPVVPNTAQHYTTNAFSILSLSTSFLSQVSLKKQMWRSPEAYE